MELAPIEESGRPPSATRAALHVLAVVALAAAGAWALYALRSIVLLLLVAVFFAYAVAPVVRLAERSVRIRTRSYRLSRGSAIALVYVLLAGSAAAGAALLLPAATAQLDELIARVPGYARSAFASEEGWARYYERQHIPEDLRRSIDETVRRAGESVAETARGALLAFVRALVSDLPWLALVPILAFFFLKDAAGLRRLCVTALPRGIRLRAHRLCDDLHATLAAYLRAQLLACLLVGGVCGIGFVGLGVPYPAVLGVGAGILEFVPLVGPMLLAVAAVVLAALRAPVLVFRVIAFLAVVRVAEDYVVYPRLVRRGIPLHPLAIIVSVLAGGEIGGIAGVFLAVPAMAVAAVVYRHWLVWVGGTAPGGA